MHFKERLFVGNKNYIFIDYVQHTQCLAPHSKRSFALFQLAVSFLTMSVISFMSC